MARLARFSNRRTSQTLLVLLALFLLGTVSFLWAVKSYFAIDAAAIIRPEELGTWEEIQLGTPDTWKQRYPWLAKALSLKPHETSTLDAQAQQEFDDAIARHAAEAAKAAGFGDDGIGYIPTGRNNTPKDWNPTTDPPEKIPRIIHQTWKDATLPPQWEAVRKECAHMHPDYRYMLWTDADSRNFLVEHYPWFVPIFDAYPYPIQRADAIRYFILHKYGGIYMDLDVGCLRRFDPLLRFEVVLPKTIPVGVSNDVMASAAGHPFMDHLIHNLVTFNHRYLTHYPTVMFSTGPMFVSASYGLYVDANGSASFSTPSNPTAGFSGIRVLPKALYGKNAKPSEAPDAFFRHFYGSSWHANDASFLIFLRDHGRLLIFVGLCVVAYGFSRSIAPRLFSALGDRHDRHRRPSSRRRGRWVSLPFVRDPRSGRYRSVSRSLYGDSKNLFDESTQTGCSPTAISAAEDELALSTKPRRVAAPQPQRAGLPLFNLGDSENSNGEEEIDLGPGLNAERITGSGSTTGILSWMNMSRASSTNESRPESSASATMLSEACGSANAGVASSETLSRSGSASKSKQKYKSAGSVLYLPAFLVGSGSSSASTDSGMASIRTIDDDSSQSPTNSSAYSLNAPGSSKLPLKSSGLHVRANSHAPGSTFSNWAASFSSNSSPSYPPGSAEARGEMANVTGSQDDSSSNPLQKMWNGVGLGARTPSPSMFLQSPFTRRRSDERTPLDVESTGSTDSNSFSALASASSRPNLRRSALSTSAVQQTQQDLHASSIYDHHDDPHHAINDASPPPPYDGPDALLRTNDEAYRQDGSNEPTPTLSALRKLGR